MNRRFSKTLKGLKDTYPEPKHEAEFLQSLPAQKKERTRFLPFLHLGGKPFWYGIPAIVTAVVLVGAGIGVYRDRQHLPTLPPAESTVTTVSTGTVSPGSQTGMAPGESDTDVHGTTLPESSTAPAYTEPMPGSGIPGMQTQPALQTTVSTQSGTAGETQTYPASGTQGTGVQTHPASGTQSTGIQTLPPSGTQSTGIQTLPPSGTQSTGVQTAPASGTQSTGVQTLPPSGTEGTDVQTEHIFTEPTYPTTTAAYESIPFYPATTWQTDVWEPEPAETAAPAQRPAWDDRVTPLHHYTVTETIREIKKDTDDTPPSAPTEPDVPTLLHNTQIAVTARVESITYTQVDGTPYQQLDLYITNEYLGQYQQGDRISVYERGGYMPLTEYLAANPEMAAQFADLTAAEQAVTTVYDPPDVLCKEGGTYLFLLHRMFESDVPEGAYTGTVLVQNGDLYQDVLEALT